MMGLRRETLKCSTLKLHVKQFGSGVLGAEVARDSPPAYKRVHLHSVMSAVESLAPGRNICSSPPVQW